MKAVLAVAMTLLTVASTAEVKVTSGGRIFIKDLFTYMTVNPMEPGMIAVLREALMLVGINPNGVKIIHMLKKKEVFRNSYKASFHMPDGRQCFMKWRVWLITQTIKHPHMPTCATAESTLCVTSSCPDKIMVLSNGDTSIYDSVETGDGKVDYNDEKEINAESIPEYDDYEEESQEEDNAIKRREIRTKKKHKKKRYVTKMKKIRSPWG